MTKDKQVEYYTAEQTAELLQVSVPIVYTLIKEKGLPVVKLGERMTRIPREALEKWMEEQIRLKYKTEMKGGDDKC